MFAYDAHTHSNWSDGRNSLEENVRCAEAVGLEVVVATDHYHPERMDLRDYVEDLIELDAASTVKVVPGAELAIQDSEGRVLFADSERALLRFVLADLGGSTRGIAVDPPASLDRYFGNVFRAYQGVVANPLVDALAHPFNLGRFPANVTPAQLPRSGLRELAAAMFERDVAFEIMNQMCWWFPDMPVTQFDLEYADVLALFGEANVKFVISSDAHSCGAVGNDRWCQHIMRLAGLEKSQVLDLPKKFGSAKA
jgi:histidinol phosphatase-like PHP family hydrolase